MRIMCGDARARPAEFAPAAPAYRRYFATRPANSSIGRRIQAL
jgi:hypothetical protein